MQAGFPSTLYMLHVEKTKEREKKKESFSCTVYPTVNIFLALFSDDRDFYPHRAFISRTL